MLKPVLALLLSAVPAAAIAQEAVLDIAGPTAPTLDVGVMAATDGGWDLSFAVANLTLSTERIGGAHVAGEGHVSVAVGEAEPVATGEAAYHVPALEPGVHEITVGLRTNDGQAYAADGVRAEERLFVLSSGAASRPAAIEPEMLDVTLAGGALAGGSDTFRAALGDLVVLRWASDSELELHLHGYDVEAEVAPDSPMTMIFEATIPGRFPIEAHGAAGEATLLYVEVLP